MAVELKNDVELTGKLHSVDQYLNVKLEDVQVVKKERYPQLVRGGGFGMEHRSYNSRSRLPRLAGRGTLSHVFTLPIPIHLPSFHHARSAGCQERLHPRIGHPIYPTAGQRGGRAASTRLLSQGQPKRQRKIRSASRLYVLPMDRECE